MASSNEVLTAGSKSLWKLEPKKDGASWDITGGSATVTFHAPDGTALAPKTATLAGTPAVASYAGDADLLQVSGAYQYGAWGFTWKATDSAGVVIVYEREYFTLVKA